MTFEVDCFEAALVLLNALFPAEFKWEYSELGSDYACCPTYNEMSGNGGTLYMCHDHLEVVVDFFPCYKIYFA